jgi:hypothetical protein
MSLPPDQPPTDVESIPSAIVLDTSVVSAIGRPTNAKYLAFADLFTTANSVGHIPQCVMDELNDVPQGYAAHARIHHGVKQGWMSRGPSFSSGAQFANGPTASTVADAVRARMADTFGVREDEVEKVDTLLPAIAVQLLAENDRAGVVIKDKHAAQAAHTVLEGGTYEDLIRIYRGKQFIEFATGWSERSTDPGIY